MGTEQISINSDFITNARFCVDVGQDMTNPRGNVLASGDDEVDRAAEQEVFDRINAGDVWAWADVRVTVEIEIDGVPFLGESCWLGGCSYKDEEDFRENSGYYDDMCKEAIDDLRKTLCLTAIALKKLGFLS